VIVSHAAVRTLHRLAVLTERFGYLRGRTDHSSAARLAPHPQPAASHRREHVVDVHGADEKRDARPHGAACDAVEQTRGSVEAVHADGIQVRARLVVEDAARAAVAIAGDYDVGLAIAGDGREEEESVNDGVLVVDDEGSVAHDACDAGYVKIAEVYHEKCASVIVTVLTFILHLNLVCVAFHAWQCTEHIHICSLTEYIPRRCLTRVCKEIKLLLLPTVASSTRSSSPSPT